ncbi:unnamed protein product [Paramecium primaurelia]|uniref:Uncharacterized protein n=1 Tax=Paramecium primaurelia TaxID=5886 RepID=A0A8S1JY17_PARPR|nr:unnamed protein product [Paramecium primaurelia]
MNQKSNKVSPNQKTIGFRFNCAINLELLKKSTRMALLKMKYQLPEESDRIKMKKRSLIFAKNQLESEKKLSTSKIKFLDTIKTRCSSIADDNNQMSSKIIFQKYSKQLDNINYGNHQIFQSIPSQKDSCDTLIFPFQKSIYPQRKLVRKHRAETQYTINSSINQPSPNNAKIKVQSLLAIQERFGDTGWEVEPSDDL